MNINSYKHCTRQTFVSLWRNRWLALVSAGMIAVSLAILGAFLIVAVNTKQIMQNIQSNLEISVFLYDHADADDIQDRLAGLDGVTEIRFVCRHEGLREFGKTFGDDALLEELTGENNPLPDVFRVRVREAELIPALTETIELFPGVETVEYGVELTNTLTAITDWVNRISLGVSALLAAGAVFLVVTTIRLSVLIRREEIGIMKHLGASNWFIRFPFLLEGLLIGWVGALASASVLGFAYYHLAAVMISGSPLFFLQPVTATEKLVPIFTGLLLLGTLMGGLGSIFSIRKFLRV